MMRFLAALLLSCSIALPALALDGISLSQPVADTAAGECPALTKIKYPWLACASNAWGGTQIVSATVAPSASWSADRRIPLGYPIVEGVGHWGQESE